MQIFIKTTTENACMLSTPHLAFTNDTAFPECAT